MTEYLKPTAEHLHRAMAEQRVVDREFVECESCAQNGEHGVPAVGHSENPEWAGYDLCQECIDEYDRRDPINNAN